MEPEHAKLQIVSKLSTTRRKCPNYLFVEQNRTDISILARATNVHGSSLGDKKAATRLKYYFEMLLSTSTIDRKCWDKT